MKVKRSIKNIVVGLFILSYIFVYRFLIYKNFLKYNESITASFTILLLTLSILFYGYRKIAKAHLNKLLIKQVIINIIQYFFIIYCCGILVGFLTNSYSLKLASILDNITPLIVTIVCIELFRYIFIRANKDKKIYVILANILIVILEVNLQIRYDSFGNLEQIFKFTSLVILPIILKNILCTYFVYQNDFKTSLIYRLITETYIYVLPILPDFNDYFMSIASLILPFVILIKSIKITDEYSISKTKKTKKVKKSIYPLVVILVLLICLIRGIGPIQMIGIESPSMSPAINVGDAVIIDKMYKTDKLKKDDVIAYKDKNDLIIVHRIININSDGTYITKGDQNNTADFEYVKKESIVGKVVFKVPYIAYPSVFIKNVRGGK